jgi:hypothetical protein
MIADSEPDLRRDRCRLPDYGRDEPIGIRREAMSTVNHDNCMHVIWHHDERIDFDIFIVASQTRQFGFRDVAQAREVHFVVRDLAEYACTVLSANCDEVPAAGAIVPDARARRGICLGRGSQRRLQLIISCRGSGQRDVASNVSTTVLFWNLRPLASLMRPHSFGRLLARQSAFRR